MPPDATTPATSPSVCLTVCHFGPWPGWGDVWLKCCAANPSLHFLVAVDTADLPSAPANVRFLRLTPADFQQRAAACFGRPVAIATPYKLCDYKPTFGMLFRDELAAFDYWGYTDLDVVYGDLRRFLAAAELHRYDVLSARKEFLVGHFTLFRNVERIARLYEHSIHFPQLFDVDDVVSFDECGRQWDRLRKGLPPNKEAACDSMMHVVDRLSRAGRLSARLLPLAAEWPELGAGSWRLRWESGRLRLLDPPCEVMYFHFHRFKGRAGYKRPEVGPADIAFDCTSQGIERRLCDSQ